VYDADIGPEFQWDMLRMKLFDEGHELSEIDKLSFYDIGTIIGYKSGVSKGEEKMAARNKRLSRGSSKG
jgi:hypothetical protein